MSKHLTKLSALALIVGLAAPVHAQDASTVVATVNGTEITLGHMITVRATLPEQYQQLPDDVLFDGILNQLIQQTTLAETRNGAETMRMRVALENEKRAMLAAEAVEGIATEAVTDEALQAAYDEQFANAEQGTEFSAAHILVETEEEAQALITELEGGAEFAALAREKSTGPSGPNGGDLGWFSAGMMVQPFQDAVEALEVGKVSAPVQTQFGWHVIQLKETREKDAPTLDAVREQLSQSIQQEAVEASINALVEAASVDRMEKGEIDAALLRNTDLLDQ